MISEIWTFKGSDSDLGGSFFIWPDLIWPNLRSARIWSDLTWPDLIWDQIQAGLIWSDLNWSDPIGPDLTWCQDQVRLDQDSTSLWWDLSHLLSTGLEWGRWFLCRPWSQVRRSQPLEMALTSQTKCNHTTTGQSGCRTFFLYTFPETYSGGSQYWYESCWRYPLHS